MRLHGHELRPSSNQPTWPGPDGLWRAQATCPRMSRGVYWRQQHPTISGAVATRPAPLAWALRSMKSKAAGAKRGALAWHSAFAFAADHHGRSRRDSESRVRTCAARLGFELARALQGPQMDATRLIHWTISLSATCRPCHKARPCGRGARTKAVGLPHAPACDRWSLWAGRYYKNTIGLP